MKNQPERKLRPLNTLSDLDAQKLYLSEHKPSHHEKWNDFADAHPDLARNFLVRSNFVREGKLDSGDAYLHAAADLYTEMNRLQVINDLRNFTNKFHSAKKHRHNNGATHCEMCKQST